MIAKYDYTRATIMLRTGKGYLHCSLLYHFPSWLVSYQNQYYIGNINRPNLWIVNTLLQKNLLKISLCLCLYFVFKEMPSQGISFHDNVKVDVFQYWTSKRWLNYKTGQLFRIMMNEEWYVVVDLISCPLDLALPCSLFVPGGRVE